MMAPVWAKDRFVEHDEPEYLAAFAGLDGETFVDVRSGRYFTRQFTLVPNESFFRLFDETGARTEDFKAYLQKVLETSGQAEAGASKEREDTLRRLGRKVERFGTRHLKALRITHAYPESTIAITCSSSGPVRLWYRGIEIKEF